MIFNPSPALSVDYPINRLGDDAIVLGDTRSGFAGASAPSDSQNVGGCKLSVMVIDAAPHPAARCSISDVLRLRIAAKVRDVHAWRIIALVQNVHALWNSAMHSLPRVPMRTLFKFVVANDSVAVTLGNLPGPLDTPSRSRLKMCLKAALKGAVGSSSTISFDELLAAVRAFAGVCAVRIRDWHRNDSIALRAVSAI